MGKFSYYQGLNYLAAYFLNLYEGDEVKTYNVLITLLNHQFSIYLNHDLSSLKKLFFFFKKLMKTFLPELNNFFDNEIKLDLQVVFASWALTLFTT